jgi:hypothetical protein
MRPIARPIRKPRIIFSPFDPPLAMPMNLSRNKSFANESVGTRLPVVPAVEEESSSGDEECSPRERSSNIGEAGMASSKVERQAMLATDRAQKGSRRLELASKVNNSLFLN